MPLTHSNRWKDSDYLAILLITDSAADYTPQELKEKNIICVPLSVSFGDEPFPGGPDADTDGFYKRLTIADVFPKTSQPSPEQYMAHFEQARKNGDTVICVTISSELSGTYQCASIARELSGYDKIFIIDSLTASIPQRIIVDFIHSMIGSGYKPEEIVAAAELFKRRVKVLAMVDTLEYLYKGGRLSATQAFIGGALNMKPLVTVTEDGKVSAFGKAMGKCRAFKTILSKLELSPPDDKTPVVFLYSYDRENCIEFKKKFISRFPNVKYEEAFVNIGPVIGAHIGIGAVGIAYVERAR